MNAMADGALPDGVDARREAQLREQFRLDRIQLYNWGTFSGLHTVLFSRNGHLVLGPSGSGKSTLLDAKTALLAPSQWMDFNAAARDPGKRERDRDLVTYVRGAWRKMDSGEGGTALDVLRPKSTWSAIGMTFATDSGRVVTLAQIFWIRGAEMDAKSLGRHFLVLERDLDLKELEFFGKEDFNIRKLKQTISAAYSNDVANGYRDCFQAKLGIPSEQALKLLHKAQSTKNISDLNAFMRELMLERPATFGVAQSLVEEFTSLDDAYSAVVKARDQINLLNPARAAYLERQQVDAASHKLRELEAGVDHYRAARKDTLLNDAIRFSFQEQERLEALALAAEARARAASDQVQTTQRALVAAGGETAANLAQRLVQLADQETQLVRKYQQVEAAFNGLGLPMPGTAEDYANTAVMARARAEELQKGYEQDGEDGYRLKQDLQRLTGEIQSLRDEIAELERKPSNIPKPLRDLRVVIAASVRCHEDELPYAGELIEVHEDERHWRPALERLLGKLATSMLVPENLYLDVLRFVDENNLRQNFTYHRVNPATQAKRRDGISARAAARKLQLRAGDFHEWLDAELRSRFDHECVDNRDELKSYPFALTLAGQIRGGRSAHEKRDGKDLNSPASWALGWDNTAKLRSFVERRVALEKQYAEETKRLDGLLGRAKGVVTLIQHAGTVKDTSWTEIDVASCRSQIQEIRTTLDKIRTENPDLVQLEHALLKQQESAKSLNADAATAAANVGTEIRNRGKLQDELNELRADPSIVEPTPTQAEGLSARYTEASNSITLSNLDNVTRIVQRKLSADMQDLMSRSGDLKAKVESAFQAFKATPGWAMDSADLDASIASADGFIALLEELERDRLPEFEGRFFNLLQTHSDRYLATLASTLSGEADEIETRIDSVNAALMHAPFGRGTHLRILSRPINQAVVVDFKKDLKSALSQSFGAERPAAEGRFLMIKKLVERLKSPKSEDERWRNTVLDVRQHVEFLAQEMHDDGTQGEVLDGGGGKSGGQRQKLTTTCLAAALRFQLVGSDQVVPQFAPVIIDEAFDKADHEHTSMAVGILRTFGFQLIVATPMKAVTTFEPFIGGATLVSIRDRNHSAVRHLTVSELMEVARGGHATQ